MTIQNPEVTVIIPVFNREDVLPETVNSILNQDTSSWELILVDDGSTDNSRELIRSYAVADKRISCYDRPANLSKGANSCRNLGFLKSKGSFIKWVDSDDLLTPDALSSQLVPLKSDSQLKVCFGQGQYFQSKTGITEELWSRNVFSENIFWDYLRNQIRWPVGGPLWRRDHFKSEPFDPELKNSQEWLMHALQLLRLEKFEYHILNKVIYRIRRGNLRMSSQSNRTSTYFYNEYLARVTVYKNLPQRTSLRIQVELIKQMAIYYFHFVKGKFS